MAVKPERAVGENEQACEWCGKVVQAGQGMGGHRRACKHRPANWKPKYAARARTHVHVWVGGSVRFPSPHTHHTRARTYAHRTESPRRKGSSTASVDGESPGSGSAGGSKEVDEDEETDGDIACEVCQSTDDGDKMLLCGDGEKGCDLGYSDIHACARPFVDV